MPLLATPDKYTGAQEASGNWAAFSLNTFFSPAWMQKVEQCRSNCRGGAKESIPLVGAGTDIKIICRDSDAVSQYQSQLPQYLKLTDNCPVTGVPGNAEFCWPDS